MNDEIYDALRAMNDRIDEIMSDIRLEQRKRDALLAKMQQELEQLKKERAMDETIIDTDYGSKKNNDLRAEFNAKFTIMGNGKNLDELNTADQVWDWIMENFRVK
jgi:hypothetical protein